MNQLVELIGYAGDIEQGTVQVNGIIDMGTTSQVSDHQGQQQH